MPYANIPRMDRENFYRDTFEFSDKTKKYALSKIKSVLTALGCSYSWTYCYVSSLIDNLREAYSEVGVRPPSIIQDRLIETVVQEGEEILTLDKICASSPVCLTGVSCSTLSVSLKFPP